MQQIMCAVLNSLPATHMPRLPLMYIPSESPSAPLVPDACPFCKSQDVKTTSKEVNASTYWRCGTCGQVWNAGRLQYGRSGPYGRFA